MTSKPSSPLRPWLRSVPLLVGGIVIGFALGRISSPDPGSTAAEGKDRPSPSTATPGARPGLSPGDSRSTTGSRSENERGATDALAALRGAMDESDPVAATRRFTAALQSITAAELAVAAKELWTRPGSSHETTERIRLLEFRWGQLEGAAAVDFAQAQTGQGKVTAISAALAGWASRDPNAAKAWIDGKGDARMRLLYDLALVDGWARHDPAGATDYLVSLPGQANTDRMLRIVAGEQVRRDPAGAGPWALSLPEGALRTTALTEVATRWVWADPAAALDWAAALPDPAQLPAAMNPAMRSWTRIDPASAGDYLAGMPKGAAKDHAVSAFSQAAAPEAPATSAAWAATISDVTLREESLVAVGRTWLRRDPEAAQAWLAESGLSQEARTRVTAR